MEFIRSTAYFYVAICLLLAIGLPIFIDFTNDSGVETALKLAHHFAVSSITIGLVLAFVFFIRRKGTRKQ